MQVQELTDQLHIDSMRMAIELVEVMDEKHVDHSLTKLDLDTKKAILSQYLAKAVIFPEIVNAKPSENG